MKRTERRLQLCTALLVCCLAFIWGNSLLPADTSGRISGALKEFLDGLLPHGEGGASSGDGLLRKFAHFAEFGMLGLCLGWLFGMLGKKWPAPFLLGTAAACVDETIQIFVPGRGPGIRDVCIDSCGVAAGMLLLHLGHAYFRKRSTRKNFRRK